MAKDVRELSRAMGQAHPTWGSPRIMGDLRKLGIEVAQSTVEKSRVHPRKPSSPPWPTLLKNHAPDLVALDCFTVPTGTFNVLRSISRSLSEIQVIKTCDAFPLPGSTRDG